MLSKQFIFYFILYIKINLNNGYCWQAGWNPGFNGSPVINQVTATSVRVSWKDIVINRECADQFVVKYWEQGQAKSFKMSKLVSTKADAIILTGIKPEVEYTYQAIAREDKGIVGTDYNRAPLVKFRTRRHFTPPEDNQGEDIREAVSHGQLTRDDLENNIVESIVDKDVSHSTIVPDNSSNYNTVELRDGSNQLGMEPKSRKKIWIFALLIVGGVVILLLVVGVSYNCIRRIVNRKKDKSRSRVQLMGNNDGSQKKENVYEKQPSNKDDQDSTDNDSVV